MPHALPPVVDTVSAPLITTQLLNKLGLAYQVHPEQSNIAASKRLQAIMLEDSVGPMLLLFRFDQLLDLNRLEELTGRKFTALKPQRLKRMLAPHNLSALPGLPPMTNSPCTYDESILEHASIWVASGAPGVLLEIPRADFKTLLTKANCARFAEPLDAIRINYDRPNDDRAEINQAVNAFTARRIQQRLEETIEIPPLSVTARKITKLRVEPNATIEDITGVVETDPALAAQVVSWAASPYYAAPGKIRSVEDAIVRVLGFDLVINLALGLALGKTLSLPKDQPQHATPYWQQAIYTAAVIEGLTRAIPRERRPEPGLAYLAGLLHNFGYLLLAHVFPPHFSLICRHLEANPHAPHSYIEQHLLGISREQISAWLMRYWDMPNELANALRFQHDSGYSGEDSQYANLVYVATGLLRNRGIGQGPQREIPQALLDTLGLTRDKANHAVNTVLEAEATLRELALQFQPAP